MKSKLYAIVILLFCVTCSVFGAGKLSVTQEDFHVVPTWLGTYGYAFARVENIGDKPTKVNAGILEVFDINGDAIISTDYINAYAAYLNPGEYTYVRASSEMENSKAQMVEDYSLTLSGKSYSSSSYTRLPCATDMMLGVQDGWVTYNYMLALITNNTDDLLYGVHVVFALLGEDDNILLVTEESLYSDIALPPGSSILFRTSISDSFVEYYESNGLTAAKVDAIAYVIE